MVLKNESSFLYIDYNKQKWFPRSKLVYTTPGRAQVCSQFNENSGNQNHKNLRQAAVPQGRCSYWGGPTRWPGFATGTCPHFLILFLWYSNTSSFSSNTDKQGSWTPALGVYKRWFPKAQVRVKIQKEKCSGSEVKTFSNGKVETTQWRPRGYTEKTDGRRDI